MDFGEGVASLPFWVGHPSMDFHHEKKDAYALPFLSPFFA